MDKTPSDEFMKALLCHTFGVSELLNGREDLEPECRCYCVGDQADASDCPLHRENR